MVRPIDLTNQKFGKLTVLKRVENTRDGGTRWLCECECGSEPKVISGSRLRAKNNPTLSCGCLLIEHLKGRGEDLKGQTFDALTALEYIPGKGKGRIAEGRILSHWRCQCICGEIVNVKPQVLKDYAKRQRYRLSCGAPRCAADSELIGPILPIEISRERKLKTYFPGIKCSKGHFSEHLTSNQSCLLCHNRRSSEFTANNPELVAEYQQKYKSKPDSKAKRNARLTNRRLEDQVFYISEKCKTQVKSVFRNKRVPKDSAAAKLLGISSWDELARHIESQFGNEYSWENRDQWHVDHIRPIASFDITRREQQLVAFNWRNLQPLWGLENISKNDTYEPIDEAAWSHRMRELGFTGELFLRFEGS